MPEITVAITTHNLDRYIVPCLEELLGQTYQDFESLVYDDFSADGTKDPFGGIPWLVPGQAPCHIVGAAPGQSRPLPQHRARQRADFRALPGIPGRGRQH